MTIIASYMFETEMKIKQIDKETNRQHTLKCLKHRRWQVRQILKLGSRRYAQLSEIDSVCNNYMNDVFFLTYEVGGKTVE